MAQATPQVTQPRATLRVTRGPLALALAGTLLIGLFIGAAVGRLGSFSTVTDVATPRSYSPAVVRSGAEWERQRIQQSIRIAAGSSAVSAAVLQSGRDWEQQRRQQSGGGL